MGQLHSAVPEVIKRTEEHRPRAGIGVSLCGDTAGDSRCVLPLLNCGLCELSVNARRSHKSSKRSITSAAEMGVSQASPIDRCRLSLYPSASSRKSWKSARRECGCGSPLRYPVPDTSTASQYDLRRRHFPRLVNAAFLRAYERAHLRRTVRLTEGPHERVWTMDAPDLGDAKQNVQLASRL